MSKKSKERRKERAEAKGAAPAKPPMTAEVLRRRRNRRFLFVALIGVAFPILEVIAYRFRAITITLVNRTDNVIKGIKVTYAGGAFDAPELKPGGSLTRLIRPDFTFNREQFSTYNFAIRFTTEEGNFYNQMGRAGTLDYSAQELYTVTRPAPGSIIQVQHTTRLGFPLSLVRGLMDRLGFG